MWTLQVAFLKKIFVMNHAKNMRDRKNGFFLKQDPDPAENGPDPQPWGTVWYRR